MQSNHLKIVSNYLILLSIIAGKVRAQSYGSYHHYARPQYYEYQQPQKTTTQQFSASAPVLPAQAPANLNVRQNHGVTTQTVQGSERFSFEMIYVSVNILFEK